LQRKTNENYDLRTELEDFVAKQVAREREKLYLKKKLPKEIRLFQDLSRNCSRQFKILHFSQANV